MALQCDKVEDHASALGNTLNLKTSMFEMGNENPTRVGNDGDQRVIVSEIYINGSQNNHISKQHIISNLSDATKKTKGRQKIEMKKISNKCNLQVIFSKRQTGVFKKTSELATLCGVDLAKPTSGDSNGTDAEQKLHVSTADHLLLRNLH
ncbi:hypothetical protein JHK87_039984 [Glycine soja]|nr:hypothetical protein JHK87_039984 [Glycine soja]